MAHNRHLVNCAYEVHTSLSIKEGDLSTCQAGWSHPPGSSWDSRACRWLTRAFIAPFSLGYFPVTPSKAFCPNQSRMGPSINPKPMSELQTLSLLLSLHLGEKDGSHTLPSEGSQGCFLCKSGSCWWTCFKSRTLDHYAYLVLAHGSPGKHHRRRPLSVMDSVAFLAEAASKCSHANLPFSMNEKSCSRRLAGGGHQSSRCTRGKKGNWTRRQGT